MLRFRLFGMPVVVRGSFLLIAAFVGFIGVGDVARSVAWLVIVFVSILVHELGHAFTARMYGSAVAIELNGLGGLTRWAAPDGELTPGRRAMIAAAGSAVGLVFGGLVWVVARQFDTFPPLTRFVLETIIYVNVFWGLLNWLPIRALDGGHLLESFLEKVVPKRAEMVGRIVFTATAAAGLIIALQLDLLFIAILAGWMLLSEFASTGQGAPAATGLPTLDYDTPVADDPPEPLPRDETPEETKDLGN